MEATSGEDVARTRTYCGSAGRQRSFIRMDSLPGVKVTLDHPHGLWWQEQALVMEATNSVARVAQDPLRANVCLPLSQWECLRPRRIRERIILARIRMAR